MPVGIVIIGRNEGERLRRCLLSVVADARPVVYVDSGSSDQSVSLARSLGAGVVELPASEPFTAARGRNAGFEQLMRSAPQTSYVQFMDGDCEMDGGWLAVAERELDSRPDVGVVCGRRRERFPERSIYNRLCDLEWDTTVGEARECGGDAMMRVEPFRTAGGFNAGLIAGEEPELCVRLRLAGWRIIRLDAEMTLHDAAMSRFGQWWKRNVRAGFAFAQGAALHGRSPARHWVRESRRNWLWGALLPLIAIATAWRSYGLSLGIAIALYALLTFRIYRRDRRLGRPASPSAAYASFCTLSKFAQAQGQIRYLAGRLLRRRPGIIEYKPGLPAGAC